MARKPVTRSAARRIAPLVLVALAFTARSRTTGTFGGVLFQVGRQALIALPQPFQPGYQSPSFLPGKACKLQQADPGMKGCGKPGTRITGDSILIEAKF